MHAKPIARRIAICLVILCTNARGDADPKSTPPDNGRILIEEDFQKKPPLLFQTQKSQWSPKGVQLGAGSALAKIIEANNVGEFRATLSMPEETQAAPCEIVFQLMLTTGARVIVLLRQDVDGMGMQRRVQVILQVVSGGKPNAFKLQSAQFERPFDGKWTIRFRYGLLHIEHEGNPILIGHAPVRFESIRVVGMAVVTGGTIVADASLSVERPLEILDAAKLTEATALRKQADDYISKSEMAKWGEVAPRLHRLYEEALGADHPNTNLAHHDVGAALSFTTRIEESANVLVDALTVRRRILGADHPFTALTARSAASQLSALGRNKEALELAEEVLRISTLHYGPIDPRTVEDTINVASYLRWLNGQAKSDELLDLLLEECRKRYGEDHLLYAKVLQAHACNCKIRGDLVKAKEELLTATAIFRKHLPGAEVQLFDSVQALSDFHIELGELVDAGRCIDEVMAYLNRQSGPELYRRVLALTTLAQLEGAKRNPANARKHFHESIALIEEMAGKDSERVAAQWAVLSSLEYKYGFYAQSLAASEQALKSFERSGAENPVAKGEYLAGIAEGKCRVGEHQAAIKIARDAIVFHENAGLGRSPKVPWILNTLTWTYMQMGDFAQARREQEKALAILETLTPVPKIELLTSKNRLGLILTQLGDHGAGQTMLRSMIEESESDSLPNVRLEVAGARNNLGLSYRAVGNQDLAIKEFRAAYEIHRELLGDQHPSTLSIRGKLAEAEPTPEKRLAALTEVLMEREKAHGATHHLTLITRGSIASLHASQGRHDEAIRQYREILEVSKGSTDEDDGAIAVTLQFLGLSYLAKNDVSNALASMSEAFARRWKETLGTHEDLSEAESFGNAQDLQDAASFFLSASRLSKAQSDLSRYEPFWKARALTTREFLDRRRSALSNPKGKETWAKLQQVQAQIAAAITQVRNMPSASNRLSELTAEKELLQRQLGEIARSVRKGAKPALPSPLDLARQLPNDVAVVDIVSNFGCEFQDGKPRVRVAYDAFVIRNPASGKEAISWIPLGQVAEIDAAIIAWRNQLLLPLLDPKSKTATPAQWGSPDSEAAQFLRAQLWQPLEARIDGCNTVLIVPSGALAQLPWAALPGKKAGTYLIEDVATGVLVYAQQALAELQRPPVTTRGNFFASTLPISVRAGSGASGKKPPEVVALYPPDLQGDAGKGTDNQLVILEGKDVSKKRICQQLPFSRYVHLEAHGYVLPGNNFGVPASIPDPQELLFSGVRGKIRQSMEDRNPLALTGISLMPEGVVRETSENFSQLLSGEEIASMDLANTELVVLESCETGLGRIASNGEGAFSVQRAFGLAGVRSVIGTLWIVQLGPSRILMQDLYRNIQHGKLSKIEALRQAQLRVMRDLLVPNKVFQTGAKTRVAPFYWSGYSLSGDWR